MSGSESRSENSWLRAEQVMVALDFPDEAKAQQLLDQLKGIPCYIKVGMELFYTAGPSFIHKLKEQGYKVFLDLKLHDIPNTVKGAARSVSRLGVDMFNVHAAGGLHMMEAALEGADQANTSGIHGKPLIIGVTQLTSTSQAMLNQEIGIQGTVEDTVLRYAQLSKQAGLQGVVASPLEVKRIKQVCGSSFVTVTPGIRPALTEIGDQHRVMTPKQALDAGTDHMVIGRPITAVSNPRNALIDILKEMSMDE